MSTKIPKGSQLLIYPMLKATIGAGYLNDAYRKHYGYTHFGNDVCTLGLDDFDAISMGNGVVLGTECRLDNSLGNIIVARYNNVYIPSQRVCKDLIVRYYHMKKIFVNKGDSISPYQKIGWVKRADSYHNHVHFEIDTDIDHPFHTPQVSESSSKLLIRAGADSSTLLNPVDVLVVGKNQTAIVHPLAVYADKIKDAPKYKESDFVFDTTSTTPTQTYQKLILPINNCVITAGYKNNSYKVKFGFSHFGLDMVGSTTIYGSGNGTIIKVGLDNILGNVIVAKYLNVINHKYNKIVDVVVRYNHLAKICVKADDEITSDTVLGIMGNTGKYSTGQHLHFEADCDATDGYECYSPTLSGNSNIIKAGYRDSRDTSFNPAEVLYCKTTSPDNQIITRYQDCYSNLNDVDIIKI